MNEWPVRARTTHPHLATSGLGHESGSIRYVNESANLTTTVPPSDNVLSVRIIFMRQQYNGKRLPSSIYSSNWVLLVIIPATGAILPS